VAVVDSTVRFLCILFAINLSIGALFWLHEKMEISKNSRLKCAVESAVRAVEQTCDTMDNPSKKQDAIMRVQAILGLYKWLVPASVIDTAIEAELYLIKQMRRKMGLGH